MTQRIALVTGGSRGLGKNAALKLAAKGTDILLTYHSNRQAALDVVAEIESTGTLSGPAVECIRAALADAKKRGSATWQA